MNEKFVTIQNDVPVFAHPDVSMLKNDIWPSQAEKTRFVMTQLFSTSKKNFDRCIGYQGEIPPFY